MERVSLHQLRAAVGGRVVGADAEVWFDGISVDSRTIRQGEAFWALPGERHDGHDYISEAQRRGAVLCVAEENRLNDISGPTLLVPCTLTALGEWARWTRQQHDALVIGVTGSVGKTTTRELIYSALRGQFQGIRSQRNYNNEVGLPLTLLDLRRDHEFAVLEMGAGRIGDIRRLTEIAQPEIGVVTAIALAHVQGFGGEREIIQGKGELLESLPRGGFAVLPGDDPKLRGMAVRAACPVLFVGEHENNHLRAREVVAQRDSLSFTVDHHRYEVPITGRHALSNVLCAIAIAREVGLRASVIEEGLRTFRPVAGRSHVMQIGLWMVIDDTYNANPGSMTAACRLLTEIDFGKVNKRLLIVGDMLELADEALPAHRRLGEEAARAGVDRLLACGDHAADVLDGAMHAGMKSHHIAGCRELDPLLAVLDCWLEPNDVLLVKGSRGMRMERVIEWLRERAAQESEENTPRWPRRACA